VYFTFWQPLLLFGLNRTHNLVVLHKKIFFGRLHYAMKIIPSSGTDWFAVLLLPFKVFVPGGWLMLVIKRAIIGYRMDTDTDLLSIVEVGYFLSFIVLALGAIIQYSIGARRAYLSTCGFIAAIFFFGFLLQPYLAHT
jgi:hypothetical protein